MRNLRPKVPFCLGKQSLGNTSKLGTLKVPFCHWTAAITITPSAKTCISFLSLDGDPLEGVETKHGIYIMHFCLDSFGGNFRDAKLASVWYF